MAAVTHEPLANVRLAELTGDSNPAANHHTSADTQIFHDCIGDGSVIEEDIHPSGASLLHGCRNISSFLVVDRGIKPNLPPPFEFVTACGNCHRATARQLGDLADQLATNVSPGRGRPNSRRPK
jgi:hypothetical protein